MFREFKFTQADYNCEFDRLCHLLARHTTMIQEEFEG